ILSPLPPTATSVPAQPTAAPTNPPAPTATSAPGGSGTGLSGAYYGDANFGTLKLARVDATVNFAWGNGAPGASLPADNFTVRWTGKVIPRFSEAYTFRITADDGVRLWINSQLMIDAWAGAYGGVNSAPIALQAGQPYDLKIDYREVGGGAAIKF